MNIYYIFRRTWLICAGALVLGGCKKILEIPAPTRSITTDAQFSSDALANSAIASLYYFAYASQGQNFWAGNVTMLPGFSSDELVLFAGPSNIASYQLNTNTVQFDNGAMPSVWNALYYTVYTANSSVAGLAASTGMSDSARREYTGEAKFMRAVSYFYLTNFWGDVPLVMSTDYNQTAHQARDPQVKVYQQIVQDLLDAKGGLAADFSVGKGERIRATKWAAFALLSRVYLYQSDWPNAEAMADSVIAHTQLFGLPDDLTTVFNKNSQEAILQFQQSPGDYNYLNATPDGMNYLPGNYGLPIGYLSPQQVAAFEPGDKRRAQWVSAQVYTGDTATYYAPFKYTIGPKTAVYNAAAPQYYTLLRLAEQYLVRAEARVHNNNLPGAITDLNAIRTRAGLQPTSASTGPDLLTAIQHERQTELFTEFGHRWLDLKRSGKALQVLGAIPLHAAITQTQLLYPIPPTEITMDQGLSQNPGY